PRPPQQERRLPLPPLPPRPSFTSQKLSTLPDLRAAIRSWHDAFRAEGPLDEDVVSLARYLKRVVVDEKDIDKAGSVLRWLVWLVGESGVGEEEDPFRTPEPSGRVAASSSGSGGSQGVSWEETLRRLRESVDEGLEERGLPSF
ncbi:hypothetical protein BO71DRAFT_367509, partial [Aspergillus ellipticus CBS 707.79]